MSCLSDHHPSPSSPLRVSRRNGIHPPGLRIAFSCYKVPVTAKTCPPSGREGLGDQDRGNKGSTRAAGAIRWTISRFRRRLFTSTIFWACALPPLPSLTHRGWGAVRTGAKPRREVGVGPSGERERQKADTGRQHVWSKVGPAWQWLVVHVVVMIAGGTCRARDRARARPALFAPDTRAEPTRSHPHPHAQFFYAKSNDSSSPSWSFPYSPVQDVYRWQRVGGGAWDGVVHHSCDSCCSPPVGNFLPASR